MKLILAYPGTEKSISYGTPSVKVKGKILSRLRSEAEGALAIFCDFIDREILLQADPEVFFITDHYKNYPMILLRLDKIRVDALPELVERAWRMRAPKKLVDEFDGK
ncbi:MAG TPA: MmcQ/YjbR family DNA-binding protein [Steroidobacteraceae bacterium]|nr:MmcQ/YjbR family DNA-binding protein [Steroidobacteraceae bacterium]